MKITRFEVVNNDSTHYVSDGFREGLNMLIPSHSLILWSMILDKGFKLIGKEITLSSFDVVSFKFCFDDGHEVEIEGRRIGSLMTFPSSMQDGVFYMDRLPLYLDTVIMMGGIRIYGETDLDAFEVFRHTSLEEPYTLASGEDEVYVRLASSDGSDFFFMTKEDKELWCWLCGVAMAAKSGDCIVVDYTLSDLFCKTSMSVRFFDSLNEFCCDRGIQMIVLVKDLLFSRRKDVEKYIIGLDAV